MRRSFIRSRRRKNRQAINPMESVVNLIDIMLIFACGLMVSIVSLWNINLNMSNEMNQTKSNYYQDMGRVYEDPETKQMYIIQPAESKNVDTVETGVQ
ncbi:MAG TPA: DUF2149 domain-containing protein [Syntrophomonadaceae bacterium]|nr:DUF2149 domain-containing protein [Syntrophomonadaceae bacterium]